VQFIKIIIEVLVKYYKIKEVPYLWEKSVYHGSYTSVPHPEFRKGRNTKDFGTGFYCTVIREQAERWAKRYDQPILNAFLDEKIE